MPRTVPLVPMSPDEVTAYRKRHKLTQQELADEVRISVRSIENYEQGRKPIPEWFRRSLTMLAKLEKRQAKGGAHV